MEKKHKCGQEGMTVRMETIYGSVHIEEKIIDGKKRKILIINDDPYERRICDILCDVCGGDIDVEQFYDFELKRGD